MGNLHTDYTTAAALSDHLLRCMLITQECAASVDGHQAVKVVDGSCAPLRGRIFGNNFMTHYPETTDGLLFPRSRPSNST